MSLGAQQVLDELRHSGNRLPVEALRAAAAHREFLTEPLLAALDDFVRLTQDPLAKCEGDDSLADMAMYLLAQFREPRALPHYIELCRLPEDLSDYWLSDMLLEDFPNFLASACGGNPAPIQALAEDAGVYGYARWTAINALIVLVAEGAWPRGEMLAWLERRCAVEPRSHETPFWFQHLASAAMDLAAPELLPALREAYAEGLTDPYHISLAELEKRCYFPVRQALEAFRQTHHYVTDAAEDMAWQARYREEDDEGPPDEPPGETYIRPMPKIGRNDPCPCGSGKKYKKCCMDNPAAEFFNG